MPRIYRHAPTDAEHLRALLRRMSTLVIDFGGSECFCPTDAHDTGNYCEVCELLELAREFNKPQCRWCAESKRPQDRDTVRMMGNKIAPCRVCGAPKRNDSYCPNVEARDCPDCRGAGSVTEDQMMKWCRTCELSGVIYVHP